MQAGATSHLSLSGNTLQAMKKKKKTSTVIFAPISLYLSSPSRLSPKERRQSLLKPENISNVNFLRPERFFTSNVQHRIRVPESVRGSRTAGGDRLIKGSEAMNGGGGSGGGGVGEGRRQKIMKKGMWSPQEDKILTEYVRRHGEGNWNAVHRRTPLLRCGKSCRLRWANHLRPDLKKGAFLPEEASLVVQLHAEHGNKWAHMASLLPGRTDNEIKNFWNTRMKRLQRADYPVYPRRPRRPPSTESNPSNPSLANGDFQPHPRGFFGALSSQQSNWPGPSPGQCPCHQLPGQSTIVGLRRDLNAFCAEYQLPSGAVAAGVELPSIQTTPLGATVPSSGGWCSFFATPSEERKSGLLEDLLAEAETLALKEKEKRKSESMGGDGAETAASSSFSVEVEPAEEPMDEIECMDDDLSSLLASFASTMPSPDW